jgi:hypothetical protein
VASGGSEVERQAVSNSNTRAMGRSRVHSFLAR